MIKGIAITTILILTVGILVSGLIVYQVYRTTTDSPLSQYECRARMVSWCTLCGNMGWSGGSMDSELSECASKYWGTRPADCNAEVYCSGFIPTWSGGGGGGGATTTTAGMTCKGAGGTCRTQKDCEEYYGVACMSNQYDCSGTTPCCCPS